MKEEIFFDSFVHKMKIQEEDYVYKFSTYLIEIMAHLFHLNKNIDRMTIDEIMATEIDSGNYLGKVRDYILWNAHYNNLTLVWHSKTSYIQISRRHVILMLENIKK